MKWTSLICSFFKFKGNLTYEAVGNYPAEDYFSVDQSSGRVSLIRDLKTDPSGLQTYTVSIFALG